MTLLDFLTAKETDDQPPSVQNGPKWHKMVQLEEMFFPFSLPDRLHSDQGRQFKGKLSEELCKLEDTYYHQGDGMVERAN